MLKKIKKSFFILLIFLLFTSALFLYLLLKNNQLKKEINKAKIEKNKIQKNLIFFKNELEKIKNEDQYQKNQELEKIIKAIETNYSEAVSLYENILDLKTKSKNIQKYEKGFAEVLSFLAKKNYSSAEVKIKSLNLQIKNDLTNLSKEFTIPNHIPQLNTPPNNGYQKQKVVIEEGVFMVDIVSGNLGNTKIIVDTASEEDCQNDCPVLSLAEYISRNGAYAGINGSYFCPADYPSCVDKKNSFEFLLMNKNKKYFNSEKNVYSTIPAVIFGGNYIRYVKNSYEWGRDTSVDGVIANYPLLLIEGEIVFSGSNEPKLNVKGNRSFFGSTGDNIYIGVVWNATVFESAKVIKALGIKNALNLDNGGSTALWYQGYKAGPGRNIPNAILFLRK